MGKEKNNKVGKIMKSNEKNDFANFNQRCETYKISKTLEYRKELYPKVTKMFEQMEILDNLESKKFQLSLSFNWQEGQ
tara:strand:+ start:235 stop:468 length:234 start_codon:yes stop_codon:yes gene_type:complete